ncbi:MAG: PDZ domain-containing protein [Planctomycetes bacterium]|nr:PDZ domain-containing protein [Planctomycetota bacterium]
MNRYFLLTFAFLPVIVIGGVLVLHFFGQPAQADAAKREGLDKEIALYMEVRDNLMTRWDGDAEPLKIGNGALVGAAEALGDKYTRVNPPLEAREQEMQLKGSFYGIGATLRNNPDGSLFIRSLNRDGPAERAGMMVRDVVIAVDGYSCLGRPADEIHKRIRNELPDTSVVLTVLRGGGGANGRDEKAQRVDILIKRGEITSYSVHDVHIETRDGRKFGYLRISDFNSNTYKKLFVEAVATLTSQGAEGLIVDMRGNGGGKVEVAVELVDSLIAQRDKLITFTRSTRPENHKDDKEYRTRDESAITQLPLVLLVDRSSASATEIVTGALKDMGRAVVIGERTFGKGLVQAVISLKTDPTYSMNITTTQYFTPLGRKVQNGVNGERGGIAPHIEINYRDKAEADLIYEKFNLQRLRINSEDLLETDAERRAFRAEDRFVVAALDLLSGKPVNVAK